MRQKNGGTRCKTKKRGRNDARQKKNNEETRCETKKIGRHDARRKKNSETRHKTKKIETLDAR